jgi:hypothetical protein
MKVVYSDSHDGFGLTAKAHLRLAELKGLTLYPERNPIGGADIYWTVPPDQRDGFLRGDAWKAAPKEDRVKSNNLFRDFTFDWRDLPRHDPALVQVVEELGEDANPYGSAKIAEIPEGSTYEISLFPFDPYWPDYSEGVRILPDAAHPPRPVPPAAPNEAPSRWRRFIRLISGRRSSRSGPRS